MFRVRCPQCGVIASVEDSAAGGLAECSSCGVSYEVPERKRKPAPPPAVPRRRREEPVEDEDDVPDLRPWRKGKRLRRSSAGRDRPRSGIEGKHIAGGIAIGLGLLSIAGVFLRGPSGGSAAYTAGTIAGVAIGGLLLIAGVITFLRS